MECDAEESALLMIEVPLTLREMTGAGAELFDEMTKVGILSGYVWVRGPVGLPLAEPREACS